MRFAGTWASRRSRVPPRPVSRGAAIRRVLSILAFPSVVTACGAVNTRPYLTPLPDAVIDTVHALPAVVISEIAALVEAEGFQVRLVTGREGFLETDWLNVATETEDDATTSPLHRRIRLRFFADAIGEGLSELAAEAVVLRTLDPSVPQRENEMMVPLGHAGRQMLQRVLDGIEERFGEHGQ